MFRQQYNISTVIARRSKRRFHDQTKSHKQSRVIRNRLSACIILIFYYYSMLCILRYSRLFGRISNLRSGRKRHDIIIIVRQHDISLMDLVSHRYNEPNNNYKKRARVC